MTPSRDNNENIALLDQSVFEIDNVGSFDQESPPALNKFATSLSRPPLDPSPNFQKIYWGSNDLPLQSATGKPPRPKPSKSNRADHLQGARNQHPNHHEFSPRRNSEMEDAHDHGEEGVTRSSPRLNKGVNSKYTTDNVQHGKNPSSKKAAPNPTPGEPTPAGVAGKTKPDSAAVAKERMEMELEPILKKDKATKKDDLIQILATLRRSKWTAIQNHEVAIYQRDRVAAELKKTKANLQLVQAQRTKDMEDYTAMQDELEEVRAQLADSEKKLKKALAKPKPNTTGKKTKDNELNAALKEHLKNKTDTILYGMMKFIQSEEEELHAAKMLVHYGDLPVEHIKTKEMKQAVAENYSVHIKKCLFLRRSYTTSEEYKWYKKRWSAGKPTLSVEDLVMCLERKVKKNDDTDMEKFMLYWEEILPQQVGKQLWNQKTRYYTTITLANNQDCLSHKIPLITPEHEAMTVLSIENHLQRWKKLFDEGKEDSGNKKDSNNNGLYTSTTNGQNTYGGWSVEGMEKFNDYRARNAEARKDSSKAHVEKECLQKLRMKYNIQADNFNDQQKLLARQKSARKRGRTEEDFVPPMKKMVSTNHYRLPDSEDESTEEED